MSKLVEVGGKFPWLRRHTCNEAEPWQRHKPWVWLPDGRLAVIDHLKSDGKMGVRPITRAGEYLPNTSEHWTPAQRARIPEEVAVAPADLRPVLDQDIPHKFRRSQP